MEVTMIPVLPHSRARCIRVLTALAVLMPLSAPVYGQTSVRAGTPPLEELVPTSAYSMMRVRHDPSMQFVEDTSRKVLQAVKDARFHELIIGVFATTGAESEDARQLGSLIDLVTTLVASVDWEALVENEMIYAEAPISPIPGALVGLGSMLFACRPDPDRIDELERSLAGLLGAADELTEELGLDVAEYGAAGASPTRVYSLRLADDEQRPLLQMAVRDDVIMVGFGDQLFNEALAILKGSSSQSLVRTRRYKSAVGELGEGTPSLMYFDVHRLLVWLKEEIPSFMAANHAPAVAIEPVRDIIALADFTDISVTTTHAVGRELISECWTRYRPAAVEQGNPLYLAMSGAEPTGELLDFVPADAIAFNMAQDIDLRPLYRWALERFEYYVPKASDSLLMLEGAQALMDLSIEDDLLSWVGSETITITMPSRRPGSDSDTIVISRLRDPAGARKVVDRCQAVYDALVPPLLQRLEEELASQGTSSPIRKLELSNATGSYPSMKQLKIALSIPDMPIPLPSIPTITFGVIGNLMVVTTSEQAIEKVLAVAAGEADGLWEHPAFVTGNRLPSQAVSSANLIPVGLQLQELAGVFSVVSGTFSMMAKAGGETDSAKTMVMDMMTGCMQKTASILRSIDFLDDSVSYCEVRDQGMTRYSRTSTRYLASDN